MPKALNVIRKYQKYLKNNLGKYLNKLGSLERRRRLKKITIDNDEKKKIFLYNNIKMSRSSPSATPLWPLIYGLGIVAFSVLLLALRAGIAIFLIFMIVGVAMIIFWVYYKARTKQNSDMKFIVKQPCECAICSHEKASSCLEQECACCTVVKGESTV